MKLKLLSRFTELSQSNAPFVLVTLVQVKGGAPANLGSKMIVQEKGLDVGTVGGGKLEARALIKAQEMFKLRGEQTQLVTWNLQRDIGMTCGGEVSLLFEAFFTQVFQIAIFGAGHVAQALVRTLLPLQCQVTCIDTRSEWLEKLPKGVQAVLVDSYEQAVFQLSEKSFFVVMTQGHATDMPVLIELSKIKPKAPYVGVMGSKVKSLKIRAELKEQLVPQDWISALYCPIGLAFGSNATEEIAISVVAQLLQVRDQFIAAL